MGVFKNRLHPASLSARRFLLLASVSCKHRSPAGSPFGSRLAGFVIFPDAGFLPAGGTCRIERSPASCRLAEQAVLALNGFAVAILLRL